MRTCHAADFKSARHAAIVFWFEAFTSVASTPFPAMQGYFMMSAVSWTSCCRPQLRAAYSVSFRGQLKEDVDMLTDKSSMSPACSMQDSRRLCRDHR